MALLFDTRKTLHLLRRLRIKHETHANQSPGKSREALPRRPIVGTEPLAEDAQGIWPLDADRGGVQCCHGFCCGGVGMKIITRDDTEHGVEYVRADEARAEVDRLNEALHWEQNRSERIGNARSHLRDIIVEAHAAQPELVQTVGDEWTPCIKLPVVVHVRKQRLGEAHVSTREGITPVKPDDLVMRGVSGEEYPIGRAIFEQTYTLNTTPPTAPVQEPVAHINDNGVVHAAGYPWGGKENLRPLVFGDTPPAQPAVPLTPDQTVPMYRAAWAAYNDPRIHNLADQINNVARVVIYGVEAAHGIAAAPEKGGAA
jgi:hypothetical protein